MTFTRAGFAALLQDLRAQQTESPTVDGKEALHLDEIGDRAYFVKHVAALANNVEPSYMIIGVEDGTWNPVGLTNDSPLRDSDQTQNRMNQILANRLDPNLSVRYRTYEISGVMYGLVAVEGTHAPYITAIEDQQYGGDRTQGEPSYIYRGAIHVRRGANSVIANRQSEILEIVDKAQRNTQPDEFLAACNYLDIESESFGQHLLSSRLEEVHFSKTNDYRWEYSPAQSWVSFVFYPVDGGCAIDTVALRDKLRPGQRIGRGPGWYRGVPQRLDEMFLSPQATPREFVGRWHASTQNAERILHFVRIRPSGHIETGCTNPLFVSDDEGRWFCFVTLVGYLWQMVYLSQAIYQDADFYGETAILVYLIGTGGTRLADFADGWRYIPSASRHK